MGDICWCTRNWNNQAVEHLTWWCSKCQTLWIFTREILTVSNVVPAKHMNICFQQLKLESVLLIQSDYSCMTPKIIQNLDVPKKCRDKTPILCCQRNWRKEAFTSICEPWRPASEKRCAATFKHSPGRLLSLVKILSKRKLSAETTNNKNGFQSKSLNNSLAWFDAWTTAKLIHIFGECYQAKKRIQDDRMML